MKKLPIPDFDRSVVRILSSRLSNVEVAQKLWKRNDGRYKRFKNDLTTSLKGLQSNRCAYCGTRLHEKRPHRDHVAPKSPHFKWTYWPANLVLACYCCNVDCKGEEDTVEHCANSYRRSKFNIVHPYLDDPADHLDFSISGDGVLVAVKNGSVKGDRSITLFKLMEPERVKERAKDLLVDNDVDHLHGLTRDMMLTALAGLQGMRLVPKTGS